jgi:hypothetical protein
MTNTVSTIRPIFRSRLSFLPLINRWNDIQINDNGIKGRICKDLVKRFSDFPELMDPIDDYNLLEQFQSLIEEVMNTIFPISMTKNQQYYAIAVPFTNKVIYASSQFKLMYKDVYKDINYGLNPKIESNINAARISLAYKMILKKYYNVHLTIAQTFICAYPEPEESIYNYFELEWDSQFIEITTDNKLTPLPSEIFNDCYQIDDLPQHPELLNFLPLDQFVFEGFMVIHIREVTARETVKKIKSALECEPLESNILWSIIESEIRYLLHNPQVDVRFTIFDDDKRKIWFEENIRSINLQAMSPDNNASEYDLKERMQKANYYYCDAGSNGIIVPSINKYLKESGYNSAILQPLWINNEIVGCLGAYGKGQVSINLSDTPLLKPVVEMIQNVIQKKWQQREEKADKLIKEYFTAVHPSVEWKFREVVYEFMVNSEKQVNKMQLIVFEDVYPLYGIIDIKNSTGERNKAIQQDLLYQLQLIENILWNVKETTSTSLFAEIESRIHDYKLALSEIFTTDLEQNIRSFLKEEISGFLHELKNIAPSFNDEISNYFSVLDLKSGMINIQQQKFEYSIKLLNTQIAQYLDNEQKKAQEIFPHYYERFLTDGVEFNLYIGQSITPQKKFSKLYLRNLKLWQLINLVTLASQSLKMESQMEIPLQTTQLVLSHSDPIAITFRSKERKFDVLGMHDVRYEVIKKRIDKATIKNTSERLAKVGTIAIVYTSTSEEAEYVQYLSYLKNLQLLKDKIEYLELEDVQGISGLKALRASIIL